MRYRNAGSFRTALEDRLNRRSLAEGTALWMMRRRLAMERFLARLQAPPDSPWLLKGAFALDLRFRGRARSTKDLDLGIDISLLGGAPLERGEIAERLRQGAAYPIEDYFVFHVLGEGGEIHQEPGGRTYRFTIQAVLGGRIFETFRVDVGTRPELVGPIEEIPESDTLAFAGIPLRRFRALPLPQQFAEKVHALTFPWEDRENTRVKDLVDLVLILEKSPPDPEATRKALEGVFGGRATHPIPKTLPPLPPSWTGSYTADATELGLTYTKIEDATGFVGQFLTKLVP